MENSMGHEPSRVKEDMAKTLYVRGSYKLNPSGNVDGSSTTKLKTLVKNAGSTVANLPGKDKLDLKRAQECIQELDPSLRKDLFANVNGKNNYVPKRNFRPSDLEYLCRIARPGTPYDPQWINQRLQQIRDQHGTLGFSRSRIYPQDLRESAEQFEGSKDFPIQIWWCNNFEQTIRELQEIFSSFNLEPLMPRTQKEAEDLVTNAQSSSGFMQYETGKYAKGDNLDNLVEKLDAYITELKKSGICNHPVLIAIRTQASLKGYSREDMLDFTKFKAKDRIVHVVYMLQVLVEAMFQIPFQKKFVEKCKWYSGVSTEEIRNRVRNMAIANNYWISLDQSAFDSNQSEQLIRLAFDLIRLAFHNVDDELWNAIVDSYIHRWVLLPAEWHGNQMLIREDHGTPSGSMWTQIVDSIINYIVVATYMRSHTARFEMQIMGDDNLCYYSTYSGEQIDPSDVSSYMARNFGLVINADKTDSGTKRDDPKYLSRVFKQIGVYRAPTELIANMLYSERRRVDRLTGEPTPIEIIIMAYCIEFPLGMQEIIDMPKFFDDYVRKGMPLQFQAEEVRQASGAMYYIVKYVLRDGRLKITL